MATTLDQTIAQRQHSWLSSLTASQTFWVLISVMLACIFLSFATESFDTQKNLYRPVPIDTEINPFAYKPEPIPPKGLIPEPDSVASETTIQGSLLLFKVKTESLQNRPLEFRFKRGSGTEGVVDLDV